REGWMWEKAGEFTLNAGACDVKLVDLTGAMTRCDALLFTTDLSYVPPEEPKALAVERQRLTGDGDKIADGGTFDLVVVGAGPGGLGAAFAAARNGLRVALVHDRPVLGGNANCEMEVGINGAGRVKERESGLVCEAKMRRFRHRGWSYSDAFREMADELKGRLFEFPNERVMSAEKNGDAIAAVVSRNTLTGARTRFKGRYFADGTGDGWLGLFAGAEYMHGREGRNEYNEAPAPEQRDEITMSGCVMKDGRVGYVVGYADHPVQYKTPAWADVLPKGFTRRVRGPHGVWWMENNGRFNDLEDPERARDQLVRISYAYWGWIKNESPVKDQAANAYMAEIAWKNARREGYRLVGDHILTANEVLAGTMFPDRISYGGWSLDTHDPLGMENPTGNGFWRSHPGTPLYSIPYRCIYSKNVSNLFLCGRSISVTHIAFGTIRVMATLFQLGQAAGTAAAVAHEKGGITPRECGQRHIKELQQRLLKGDHYIPRLANDDPLDLARSAKVTSSDFMPRHARFDASDPGLRRADKRAHKCAGIRRAVRFERGGARRLDTVLLNLQNTGKKSVELTAKVYLTDDAAWRPKGEPAAVLKAIVLDGRDGLVRFFNPTKPIALNARFVWVELVPAPGIAWYLREGTTGHSDLRAYCGVDNGKWTPVGGEEYAFVTEPALERDLGSSAVAVTDGMARSEDGIYHGWISDSSKELPQWVRLDFPSTVSVGEVRIAFDPDFATVRASPRPRSLVKSYVVEGLTGGKWIRLGGDSANQLRHRVHHFLPVSLEALRVTVNETWGDPSARIFEIRAYGN
ncbi:MAG: FAD-dependent oxidoreductase, partial [Kiritimatiellae bacterium]|nr:FAD-dependent oxidoreductase [Kiritimatiellia bacterium]